MKTVLLPVKTFANAKQRLAPAVDPETRAGLAQAMCTDVMNALARARVPERVIVFTAADEVIELARPFGFDVVREKSVDGHSAAVNQMVAELLSSAARILSIAIDLPRLAPSEIDFALDAASEPVTLIPSRDWTGTNGVVFISPAHIAMDVTYSALTDAIGTDGMEREGQGASGGVGGVPPDREATALPAVPPGAVTIPSRIAGAVAPSGEAIPRTVAPRFTVSLAYST